MEIHAEPCPVLKVSAPNWKYGRVETKISSKESMAGHQVCLDSVERKAMACVYCDLGTNTRNCLVFAGVLKDQSLFIKCLSHLLQFLKINITLVDNLLLYSLLRFSTIFVSLKKKNC